MVCWRGVNWSGYTILGFFLADNLDILMSFPVQLSLIRGDTQGIPLERMKAFLKRMEERPAYQRAVEKGGPLRVI
jgi:hypothetical protein